MKLRDLTSNTGQQAKKPAKAKAAPKKAKAPPKKEAADVVELHKQNLHKPVRSDKVIRQFRMSEDMDIEFAIAARERGYNARQMSDFLEEVWENWKKHNK